MLVNYAWQMGNHACDYVVVNYLAEQTNAVCHIMWVRVTIGNYDQIFGVEEARFLVMIQETARGLKRAPSKPVTTSIEAIMSSADV